MTEIKPTHWAAPQTEDQLNKLDATVVASKWHQVIFENNFLRILEVIVKVGETVPFHTHQWDSIMVTLEDSDFLIRDNSGFDTKESALEDDKLPFVELIQGSLQPHSYTNIGSKKYEAIIFEYKKGPIPLSLPS